MKTKFSRIKYSFFNWISRFLICYRSYLLVFFIIFLIAFITGIMTCSHYSSSITCEHLINKYLYDFLTKESTFISYFLKLSAYYIILFLCIIFLSKNLFMIIVNCFLIFFMSYIYGFDLCIIILSLGLSGVIFGILILGVLGVFLFLTFLLIISIATKRYFVNKKSCDGVQSGSYLRLYLMLIIVSEIILFVMCLLFSIIHIFVIVE